MDTPHPCPTAKKNGKAPLTFPSQRTAVAPEVACLEPSASHAAASPLCQSRVSRPTAKLIDGNNQEKAALTFQRAAVAAEIAHVEAIEAAAASHTTAVSPSTPTTHPTTREPSTVTTHEPSPGPSNQTQDEPQITQGRNKRQIIISSDEEESDSNEQPKKKIRRKTWANCKF